MKKSLYFLFILALFCLTGCKDALVPKPIKLTCNINTFDAPVIIPIPVEVPEEVVDENVEFVVVEEMPMFRDGTADLMKYLSENIKYPTVSAEQGVQGKVVVQFIVGVHGEILNPVVVKSVDPYLDKEAIRVISSMPKWKPGKQRGKAVRVKYTVPVVFRLQN